VRILGLSLALVVGAAALAEDRPVLWDPPAAWCCTLRDVASRLPKDTPAREPDPITYAHEASHFLSQGRDGWHGIYVGEGRMRWVPVPKLRTAFVFASVPAERRGPIYETYRKQGATEYWQDRPTMILDEWRAYTVGSLVRQELGLKTRAETVAHAMTMARFSKQAKEIPEYDMAELTKFCRWNLGECHRIEGFDTEVRFD